MLNTVRRNWRHLLSTCSMRMPLTQPSIETRGEPLWLDAVTEVTEVKLSQIRSGSQESTQVKVLRILVDERADAPKLRQFLQNVRESSPHAVLTYGLPTPADVTSISASDEKSFQIFRNFHSFASTVSSLQINWVASYRNGLSRTPTQKPRLQRSNDRWRDIENPGLTVIIPHHQDFRNLCRVLDHLQMQTLSKFEVVVVDNAVESELLLQPQVAEILMRNLALTVVSMVSPDRNLYLSGQARNVGIGLARAAKILFLDSDIVLPAAFLSDVALDLESADVVMAKRHMLTEPASQAPIPVSAIKPDDLYAQDEYWESFNRRTNWDEGEDYWKYACTYCLAVKREVLTRSGHFDGNFTMYGFEDVDLAFRFYKLGMKFTFARSDCYHLYPASRSHNYHLESSKRQNSLRAAALTFFLLRPERLSFVTCQHYFVPTFFKWLASKMLGESLQLRWLESDRDARTG